MPVQQFAWIEAVNRSDPAELERLALAPAEGADLLARLGTGDMLRRLHAELAAEFERRMAGKRPSNWDARAS